MDPVVVASARKHGLADDAILHAYRNPIRVLELDDLTVLIGADDAGHPLEIGVVAAEGIESCTPCPPDRSF